MIRRDHCEPLVHGFSGVAERPYPRTSTLCRETDGIYLARVGFLKLYSKDRVFQRPGKPTRAISENSRMQRSTHSRAWWSLLLVLFILAPGGAGAQLSTIRGRVLDRETGEVVREATVTLEEMNRVAVTDERGLFTFTDVEAGVLRVRVAHLAYGEHAETVDVEPDAVVALRILISQEAIELDPIVVEAMTRRELQARSRGTMIQEVTRAEIERAARTSLHLGDILRQTVPGLRVYDSPSIPGARVCIEFRGRRSVRFAGRCQTPMVLLDGVRMYDPPSLYGTINPSSIQRIEVVPPAEAGVLYGSESAFGVIVIETRLWADEEGRESIPPRLRGGVYDWSLEVERHSWKKVFLWSLVGNAVGLATGLALADNCVEFRELDTDLFTSTCSRWPTVGSYAAALSLPLTGAALGARLSGGTPISRGSFLPAVAAGAMAILPGYALTSAAQGDPSSPSMRAGQIMLVVGVPLAVTVADHLFRKLRGR